MSKKLQKALAKALGDRVVEKGTFRGDEWIVVNPKDWHAAATVAKNDLGLNFFRDLTAVDYPEREPEAPRFEVVLRVMSLESKGSIMLKAPLEDGAEIASLWDVWAGANWAEREVYDMFGIKFTGHPDMRRILMYDEFEGYPLRKDYPIEKTQPLVEYRDTNDTAKSSPFGIEEGQPFARIQWADRLDGGDAPVSPAIAVQTGHTRALSDSEIAKDQAEKLGTGDSVAADSPGA